MASSPRPAVAERLRLEQSSGGLLTQRSPPNAGHRGAEISFTSSSSSSSTSRGRASGPDEHDVAAQRVPLTAGLSSGSTGGAGAFGLAARSPRTPSGFGLSQVHPSYPTASSGYSSDGGKGKDKIKGHPVTRLHHVMRAHPVLFVVIGALLALAIVWLVLMPSLPLVTPAVPGTTTTTDANVAPGETVLTTPLPPSPSPSIQPPELVMPPLVDTKEVLDAVGKEAHMAAPTEETDKPAVAIPTESSASPVDEAPSTPSTPPAPAAPVAEETPSTPAPVTETETIPMPVPVPKPDPVPAAPASASPSSSPELFPAAALLNQADLDPKALHCPIDAKRLPCDWSWGPPDSPRSPNSEDHAASRADWAKEAKWKKPEDFYSFQAGVHVSGEGTGVLVRIFQRDLCCTGELPLSYFRVTAVGAAQAASNPVLALGPLPRALGRGHQAVHPAQRGWGSTISLSDTDDQRVLQTFLLLPDAGPYAVQVRLAHFNVSLDMITENYAMNSKEYTKRPGLWIDSFVKNTRDEDATRLVIPKDATAFTHADPRSLPLCGEEGGGRLGGQSQHGTSYGMPLAGRWVFHPPEKVDPREPNYVPGDKEQDWSALDKKWLVEHSVWTPYFCRLDREVPFAKTLEKVRWMHFTGDSNTRHMFFYVCEMANGTLLSVNPARVPRYLDPPHMCIGPSSADNTLDSESGMELASSARWVLTYTNWFWGKQQTLDQRKEGVTDGSFSFAFQCAKFVEQNQTGLFYGWPQCDKAPNFVKEMKGPGATYFGWGSHAAEMAANPLTKNYFHTEEAFALPHFRNHPTIFPLTTANTPSLIPDKFGKQQVMRNNERVHASNLHLREAVMDLRLSYATRLEGGAQAHRNWVPLFDLFSPTHAAYEVLACDAVHFDKFFSYEEPKWLMHYLYYSPNFGAKMNS